MTTNPANSQNNDPETFANRERDWRNGAIVYQVLVDRFAPSANLPAKQHLYAPPKTLRRWDEVPTAGQFVQSAQVWSHEIDFWGGDVNHDWPWWKKMLPYFLEKLDLPKYAG